MIRHSSAFFISLIIHLLLIAAIFYIFDVKKENDVKIAIKLCSLEEKQGAKEEKKEQKQEVLKPKETKKEQIKNSDEIEKRNDIEDKEESVQQEYECKDIAVAKTEHQKEEPQKPEAKVENTKTTPPSYNDVKKELPKENLQENYIKINKEEIAALIQENLYYPIAARKKAIEGLVIVRFAIDKSGDVSAIEIIESKSEILSRAAVKTLQNLSNKFPKPSEKIYLTLPIEYRLQR
ncbi:MAG: periplasmic protein TonB [Campylobacterota bacterium]|nr:periplasmic protein TonB [Campylobacterota bacterium]